jgi:hypothetical protein
MSIKMRSGGNISKIKYFLPGVYFKVILRESHHKKNKIKNPIS